MILSVISDKKAFLIAFSLFLWHNLDIKFALFVSFAKKKRSFCIRFTTTIKGGNMICKNCNSQIQDDSVVCPICGAPVEGASLHEESDEFKEYRSGNPNVGASNAVFCSNCGARLPQSAVVCPYCGTPTMRTYYQAPGYTPQKAEKSNDLAIAGFILSFFLPLVGLILSAIGLAKSKKPEFNGNGRGLAIAGVVLSSVFIVIAILFIVIYVIRIMTTIAYAA